MREFEMAAVTDRRCMEAAREDARPTFDCVRASQSRSELIKAYNYLFWVGPRMSGASRATFAHEK